MDLESVLMVVVLLIRLFDKTNDLTLSPKSSANYQIELKGAWATFHAEKDENENAKETNLFEF